MGFQEVSVPQFMPGVFLLLALPLLTKSLVVSASLTQGRMNLRFSKAIGWQMCIQAFEFESQSSIPRLQQSHS